MSKISTAYNEIISKIDCLYLDKTRLHNPYQIIENPEITRKNAWGLKVETADREETEYCNLSLIRNFTIVFVRQFISLAGKEDGFDSISALILEDQQTFCSAFFSANGIADNSVIDRIGIDSISGINEVIGDEKKYLFGEVTFNILISEQII